MTIPSTKRPNHSNPVQGRRLGRVGGILLLGSGIALVAYRMVEGLGAAGVISSASAALGLTLTASFLLEGAGAALVSLAGPPPLDGRATRLGLALVAVGQLGMMAAILGLRATLGRGGSEPAEALTSAVFLAPVAGILVIGLSLVRGSRRSRVVGLCLLASLVGVVIGPAGDALGLAGLLTSSLRLLDDGLFLIGVVGLGILAIGGDRAVLPVRRPGATE